MTLIPAYHTPRPKMLSESRIQHAENRLNFYLETLNSGTRLGHMGNS